ncbi:MAG: hypothetical protein R3C01_15415 [Planctomycetaceae bacterium]
MEDLVRLYLSKSLSKEKVNEVLTNRQFPIDAAFWKARPDGSMPPASQFVKGDEVELLPKSEGEVVSEEEWYNRQMQYLGRRTISRYGCYGCHDIEGFDEARPIGTALQDWGRKDTSKLAFEHIEEYLHHHGEPDGSSTMKAVEEIVKKQYNDGTATPEEQMKSLFFASLQHHGREGFLWQKLRAPRSYDHKKIETKGWDERLRMPKFPFNDHQIEAVATFVLGLVAEPPAPAYVYQPDQRKKDIIEGERLLAKFNCTSCHMMRTPGVKVEFDLRELLGGASRQELVSWFRDHGQDVLNGTITQAMLVGDEPIPDAYIEQQLANVPPRRRDAKQEELQAFYGGMSLFLNNSIMLLDGEKEGIDLSSQLATRLAQLGQTPGASGLQQWLDARPEVLVTEAQEAKTHPEALRLDFKLRPPVSTGGHVSSASVKRIVELHGMMSLEGDQTSPLDEQLYAFEVWEPTEVGGRYIRPKSKPSFNGLQLKGRLPARGGQYMQWLATHLAVEKTGDIDNVQPADINLGYQSGPPLLYKEGIKVQTPWLFDFLKNPGRIRYLTVLRMPQFNMSSEEAQALANYFAAVDGAEYPYQQNERREPDYLRAQQAKYLTVAGDAVSPHGYMGEAWKLLNADKCITCHEVGGREYVVVKDSFRGPDLKNVELRLRPDWALLWVFNPEAVTPYTSMPANIMKTPVAYPHLLNLVPTWQNNALH